MTLKNVQQQTEIAERRQQVARLYVQGKRQQEIADLLAVSAATVSTDVKAMRTAWHREATADVAVHTRKQYERLEMLYLALLPQVEKGSPRAIEVAIKLIERQAKLMGTDRPEKHEVSGNVLVEYVNDWRKNPAADATPGPTSGAPAGEALQLPGGGPSLAKDDIGNDHRD